MSQPSMFQPAVKKKQKLRCALYGPSGSGKTMSALRLAVGLAGPQGRIALIDSEHGSASLYADIIKFDTVELGEDKSTAAYTKCIAAAVEAGYDVVVIDSLTHAWRELLALVDEKSKGGNSWSGWAAATPVQKAFIETLLTSRIHIVWTMRSDTAWAQEENDRGKIVPVRVGLKPEQGKGIEYEATILIRLDRDHTATFEKDRTGKWQDQTIKIIDERFGEELVKWLDTGAPVIDLRDDAECKRVAEQIAEIGCLLGSKVKSDDILRAQINEAFGRRETVLKNLHAMLDRGRAKLELKQTQEEKAA